MPEQSELVQDVDDISVSEVKIESPAVAEKSEMNKLGVNKIVTGINIQGLDPDEGQLLKSKSLNSNRSKQSARMSSRNKNL